MSLRRKIFYACTLAVVAALLLFPGSGWLARAQLFPFGAPNVYPDLGATMAGHLRPDPGAARFAAAHPDDFDHQFAYALSHGSNESLPLLEALGRRYPDNPAVIAARLARMAAGKVLLRRREMDLLAPASTRPNTREKPSDPAAVAQFVALAEQGERVAPGNAFFPAMAAAGEFTRGNDAAAIDAWQRAGALPEWDDYTLRELEAKWRLQTARNNNAEVGFMPRAGTLGGILLPHYTLLRAGARMATVEAMNAELAGDREAGVAIRGASRHLGAVMTAKSGTSIGTFVGRAIIAIAGGRPGGAEEVDGKNYTPAEREDDRPASERQARYEAYLRSAGYSGEAAAFSAASRDGDAVKKIGQDGMNRTYLGFGAKTFRLMAGWYGCILLIGGAMAALTFAVIFKLVYRFSPRLQKGEPLQPSARWGLAAGLTFLIVASIGSAVSGQFWVEHGIDVILPAPFARGGLFAVLAFVLICPPLLGRFSARSVGHGLVVMLCTAGAAAAVGTLGAALWGMFSPPITAFGTLQGISTSVLFGEAVAKDPWGLVLPAVLSGFLICLPVLMLGVFAGISRVLRVPVAAGVTRGMRATAVPLAAFLMLGWAVCLLATLRLENAAIAELRRFAAIGEPRLLAEMQGREYPAMAEALRAP